MAVRHLEDALDEVRREMEQPQETPAEKPEENAPAGQVDEVSNPPTDDGDKAGASPAVTEGTPAPAPQKDEVGEELENANSVIRRRLEKQAQKYQKELDERDSKYAELMRQFEELKKTATPKEAPKTRDAFQTDEEYVAYLTRQQIDARDAEKEAERKEREAKEEAERKEKEAAEEDMRNRQARFRGNVEKCFEAPAEKEQFMGKVKVYLGKGLGELLDACPVASDYLLGNPRGPKVLDRLLTDRDAFVRVFDPRGITPMDQYYELKELEHEIYGKAATAVTEVPPAVEEPEPPRKAVPKYGKPGAQGGGRSADVFTDPKARRDEVRRLMGF